MTVEPSIAGLVAAAVESHEWWQYRQCRTCRAQTGEACRALYEQVIDGQPTGPGAVLHRPHAFRKKRQGR